jgi:hypothetical protein
MRSREDNWGPWADGINPAERLARLRSLRTVAVCMFGAHTPLAKPLEQAESLEPEEVEAALIELNRMPALDRRKLLSAFGRVNHNLKRAAA